MNNLPPGIRKDVEEFLDFVWVKLKRKLGKPLGLIVIAGILGVYIINQGFEINIGDKTEDRITTSEGTSTSISIEGDGNSVMVETKNEEAQVKGVSVSRGIQDFSNWDGFEKFDPYTKNDKAICPLFTEAYPEGRVMYSPKIFGSTYDVGFAVKPMSVDRANIVFKQEDIFRCIIGNRGYKNIDCESLIVDQGYIEEILQDQLHPWINRYDGVRPQTEMRISISSQPIEGSEMLKLNIYISYIPKNSLSGEYEIESFEYFIPTGGASVDVIGRLGVGLIDPRGVPYDVCAEFNIFEEIL